jgi:hypothetical protein
MRRLLGLVVLVCACGGSSAPLDPNFAGTWTGNTYVTLQGLNAYPALPSQTTVTVNGNEATTVPCGSETDQFASGSGDSASWTGTTSCPPVSLTGQFVCSSVVFTFTQSTATLNGGTLSIIGTGTADGCSASYALTEIFNGTK